MRYLLLDERKNELEHISITKPFLRWAGGKNWLIKHLDLIIPKNGYVNYHEPFLGGGSIFLAISPSNKSYLSDLNDDLIDTYKILKNNPKGIINELKNYLNTATFYYSLRNQITDDPVKKAAKFIYLNQTSFNGLYRVNLKGIYNVPYGYRNKEFLDENNLIAVSHRLKDVSLHKGDFEIIKDHVKKGDLVFLDPPYTVSHNHNSFIKYNQKLFSLNDQYRLSSLIDWIKSKCAYYILTNAAHCKILEIFDKTGGRVCLDREQGFISGNLLCLEFMLHPVSAL